MKKSVEAAQAAVDVHNAALSLERGQPSDVDLFHLIWSLLDWCEVNQVDFDHELQAVRNDRRAP